MMPFAVSISILSLAQAALVALPRQRRLAALDSLRSPWWALAPALSIVVVIGIVAIEGESATVLSWVALVGVPPLAALALGWLVRGSRPWWAALAIVLFALAWAAQGSLAGETAAAVLSGLACIALGWVLVAVAPASWLRLGIYAMAAVDTWLVAADLLQGPNGVLTAAAPGGLPRLQAIQFGSARMGFGDFFVAATLGCLLASSRRDQRGAAVLVGAFALCFDLLFVFVDILPATVPVALALGVLQVRGARRPHTRGSRMGP